jgi:chromosome segregation ATPase
MERTESHLGSLDVHLASIDLWMVSTDRRFVIQNEKIGMIQQNVGHIKTDVAILTSGMVNLQSKAKSSEETLTLLKESERNNSLMLNQHSTQLGTHTMQLDHLVDVVGKLVAHDEKTDQTLAEHSENFAALNQQVGELNLKMDQVLALLMSRDEGK